MIITAISVGNKFTLLTSTLCPRNSRFIGGIQKTQISKQRISRNGCKTGLRSFAFFKKVYLGLIWYYLAMICTYESIVCQD